MHSTLAQTRARINPLYRADEEAVVHTLLQQPVFSADRETIIQNRAAAWITALRQHPAERTLLEDFMQRYSLSAPEGVALMGLAECFLRVPDTATADKVIIDKITSATWDQAAQQGEKLLTRFSGAGLALSENLLEHGDTVLGRLAQRLSLPVIRQAIAQAIKLLGGQFVCGRTISEALENATDWKQKGHYTFSYDMLGEGARTAKTAEQYFTAYKNAIHAIGQARGQKDLYAGDGISVKLSALHPRYEETQKEHCLPVLIARVTELAFLAKKYNMLLTLDAEEASRLELSLDIMEAVISSPDLSGYNGLGLAVQAYQKRAVAVIDWVIKLAEETSKKIPVRLVKGAYWDSEIKRAQEQALSDYPVFTRKITTDVSYLVCARKMLEAHRYIYPAFATHNAFTISAILEMAQQFSCKHYEFQRLHGMGQPLYEHAYKNDSVVMPPCRIYAPVGPHHDLLPYLVRRLLENGANSSFVHQLYDPQTPVSALIENPLGLLEQKKSKRHDGLQKPEDIFGTRKIPVCADLNDRKDRAALLETKPGQLIVTIESDQAACDTAMKKATDAFAAWKARPQSERSALVMAFSDLLEQEQDKILPLLVHEAYKTWPDALSEWREAIDFCRYYAWEAQTHFSCPIDLPGVTGESNQLSHEGRGVFVCISPWNFPLAIFIGQIVAALVTGNCVVAKPAPQTPRIAQLAVDMMHKAGIPKDVIQLLIGNGKAGAVLTASDLCDGVCFTGSTETAWLIQQSLAQKKKAIVPFIAETGGQNAMIVDSTALAEHVVDDVMRSAFYSAGQRCSALRVLFLQHDIADNVIALLQGALQEVRLGDTASFATDIGPVIDRDAWQKLTDHKKVLHDRMIAEAPPCEKVDNIIVPTVFEINRLDELDSEHFGPFLHIIRYQEDELEDIINTINATNYGLTCGIHTRIESKAKKIARKIRAGNVYINRTMTGAIVGSQPFGGMNLSGTGPKAGGPGYLHRFVIEKTITINTTAAGGNTSLIMQTGL